RPLCRFASWPNGRTVPSMAASRCETKCVMGRSRVRDADSVRRWVRCGLEGKDSKNSGLAQTNSQRPLLTRKDKRTTGKRKSGRCQRGTATRPANLFNINLETSHAEMHLRT